ncbi:MAG: hypothetical protein RIG61_10970 [Deltaproteobacteria bacterium]
MSEETENNKSKEKDESKDESAKRSSDLTNAIIGGVIVVIIGITGILLVGHASRWEALKLLEALLPTTRFLSSAVMTATATILALMLTLLSLSTSSDSKLKADHYKRIMQIAFLDTAGLIVSTVFLILHCVPLEKTDQVPSSWFTYIYYTVLITSAFLGGLLVTVVLMLYNALRDMVDVIGLGKTDHFMIDGD